MKNQKKNKRMKHCFSNCDDVAKLWAAQSQSRAHCKNAFFENKIIYSYGKHYTLGIIESYRGQKIALVNYQSYSRTTSGHSSSAYYAAWNAGLITLKVQNDFSETAIIGALIEMQNDLYESLVAFQNHGAESYDRKSFARDLAEFNRYAKALGFPNLVVTVPESFWQDVYTINRVLWAAKRDFRKRKQLALDHNLEPYKHDYLPSISYRKQKQLLKACA